jgi:hypothetical protein
MRRPQLTIRTLLVLILAFGMILGFGLPALEVLRTKKSHEHTFMGNNRGRWGLVIDFVDAPFWPRYWRRLLGKPWKERPFCQATPGRIEEVCSFDHPEIVIKPGEFETFVNTGKLYQYTPVQFALYQTLKNSPTPPPPD